MESTLQTAYEVHLKPIRILYHLRVHCDKNRELSLKRTLPTDRSPESEHKHKKLAGVFIEKDGETHRGLDMALEIQMSAQTP